MPTHYDINSENLKGSLSTISNDYNFTYFKPPDPAQASQLNVSDLNMCYAGKEVPSVTTTDISLYLNSPSVSHTNNSCKLNAALLQSNRIMNDQQDIYKKTIENGLKKPGLNFNIVNGYYVGNAKYFLGKNIAKEDLATKFDTIKNATNGLITDPNYLKYSVEWYGFFCPSVSGNWKFNISGTNKSLLWVGDLAINDYEATNALADSSLRGTGETFLNKNRFYPIRIQYGNRTNTDTFSMSITGPSSEDGLPFLFTFYNSDGKLFEKALTYYSLIESSPTLTSQGLYSCYVTNYDRNTYDQLKKRTNGFLQDSVWSLMDQTIQIDNNKLDSFNYFSIDATTGIISLYNSSGNVLRSLSDSNGNPIKSTGNIKLDDQGKLQVEQINNPGTYKDASTSKLGLDTPQPNSNWKTYKETNKLTNPYKLQSNVSFTSGETPIILVSNNNQYILSITDLGNLVIYQSVNACESKDSNNVHFTGLTNDVNSRYLYRINGDEKTTKLFMENKNLKTLLPVEMNPTNLNLLKTKYTPYSGYYPPDTTGSTQNSQENCQAECDANPNCSYYYYNSNNSSCTINTAQKISAESLLPKTFIPKQPTDTGNSTLYLRNIGMNLSASDARQKIQRVDTNNYQSYAEHELLIDKAFILNDAKPKTNNIGYNGLATPLRNQLITNWNYINGTGEPRNQPDVINESFDNHNYTEKPDVRNIGGNPGNDKSLPNEIIDRQINPMMNVAQDYSNLQQEINDKYYSIDDKLNKITNNNKTGIRDVLTDDPKQIYDFKGETLYYGTKKPQKVDALKDDVQIMLVQTNDMFILGSLTIASLLIAAIYFGNE